MSTVKKTPEEIVAPLNKVTTGALVAAHVTGLVVARELVAGMADELGADQTQETGKERKWSVEVAAGISQALKELDTALAGRQVAGENSMKESADL